MLNPSTADARQDDPTIRRCQSFARALGYGGMVVCNLFAYRATEPAELKRAADPIGSNCDQSIRELLNDCAQILAAWGVHGSYRGRDRQVLALCHGRGIALSCLGVTREGHPRHPLYLRGDATPMPFANRPPPCRPSPPPVR